MKTYQYGLIWLGESILETSNGMKISSKIILLLILISMLGFSSANADELETQSVNIRVKTVTYGDGSIKTLDLESEYLPVVIACENGAAPPESMKAQAVASRTVAMYMKDKHKNWTYDIYDDCVPENFPDNCDSQVYNPTIRVNDQHRQSVTNTRSTVLKYNEYIICAFFVSGLGEWAKYVTYNEGKTGNNITQTTGGWVTNPPSKNPFNRGCMGQFQANELASKSGYNYQQILRYFYGDDIEIVYLPNTNVINIFKFILSNFLPGQVDF